MQPYRRDEYGNLDEHEKFLQLRQRIKESIRMQKRDKETTGPAALKGAHGQNNKILPYDNYGSFFGSSIPVISQRVIQESKSMSENQLLASRNSNSASSSTNKKRSGTKSAPLLKPGARMNPPKVMNEVIVPTQKQRQDAHDYSFLSSDDAELPAPKQLPSRMQVTITGTKKIPAPASKYQPSIPWENSSIQKQPVQPRREQRQESSGSKLVQKQASIKQECRPKKKAARGYSDEISSMIHKILGYNPNKYVSCDYDDDRNMEVGFNDIIKEEKRSEKIARKEDKEELLKIEEEERRSRERKRKMSQR